MVETQNNEHLTVVRKQSTQYTFNLYIDDAISSDGESSISKVRDVVAKAKESDLINIYMNSFGGSTHAMSSIITSLKNARAPICLHLTGCAMSAGLIIFASLINKAKKVFINEEASVMAHSAFTIAFGKPDEIQDFTTNFKKVNKIYLKPLKKILTKKQWNKVFKNEKELWLTGKEFYHLVKKAYPDEEGKESKINLIKFE